VHFYGHVEGDRDDIVVKNQVRKIVLEETSCCNPNVIVANKKVWVSVCSKLIKMAKKFQLDEDKYIDILVLTISRGTKW
jgi:hypothetical protein